MAQHRQYRFVTNPANRRRLPNEYGPGIWGVALTLTQDIDRILLLVLEKERENWVSKPYEWWIRKDPSFGSPIVYEVTMETVDVRVEVELLPDRPKDDDYVHPCLLATVPPPWAIQAATRPLAHSGHGLDRVLRRSGGCIG